MSTRRPTTSFPVVFTSHLGLTVLFISLQNICSQVFDDLTGWWAFSDIKGTGQTEHSGGADHHSTKNTHTLIKRCIIKPLCTDTARGKPHAIFATTRKHHEKGTWWHGYHAWWSVGCQCVGVLFGKQVWALLSTSSTLVGGAAFKPLSGAPVSPPPMRVVLRLLLHRSSIRNRSIYTCTCIRYLFTT